MWGKWEICGNSKQALKLKIYKSLKSSFSRWRHFMGLNGFLLRAIIQTYVALEPTHTLRTSSFLKNVAQVFGGSFWEGGGGSFMCSQTIEVGHQGICHFLLFTHSSLFLQASPPQPGFFPSCRASFFSQWSPVSSGTWDIGVLVCAWGVGGQILLDRREGHCLLLVSIVFRGVLPPGFGEAALGSFTCHALRPGAWDSFARGQF